MPIPTKWTIKYGECGHTEVDKDLSFKQPHERAGFARWLQTKGLCRDCYLSTKPKGNNGEWIEDPEEWSARQAAKVQEWEQEAQMPTLSGSEKAAAWASRVRHNAMVALHTYMVEEGNGDEQDFDAAEDTARHIDRASFWLDNREHIAEDPEALLELLNSAAADEGMDCENTY